MTEVTTIPLLELLIDKPWVTSLSKGLRQMQIPKNQPRIYLSQAMQGKYKVPRTWVPKFKKWAVQHQMFCFDPVVYGKYTSSDPRQIVRLDYAIVALSNLLIIDFTRGLSIGATCEMVEAHRLHIPVLGVANPRQTLSPWAHHHCQRIISPKEITEQVLRILINPQE